MDPQEAADRAALQELRDRKDLADLRAQQASLQAAPKPLGPSYGESAMRGAAHGASLGFADEAYGLIGGALNPANIAPEKGFFEGFPERYAASRDYARDKDQAAMKANPKTYYGSELAAGIASPVTAAFAPAEGASALSVIGRGAAAGATAGAGSSTAHPLQSPEEAKHFAADVGGGAALGGALAGVGRSASDFLGKLTPENLKLTATRMMAKAAGTEGMERSAGLLGAADEAGAPIVGFASKASDISDAAAAKARFYGEAEVPPMPVKRDIFNGRSVSDIASGAEEGMAQSAANQARAESYREIAARAAQKAGDTNGSTSDWALPSTGIIASAMSGHASPTHIATMIGMGVAKKALRERGAAFAGRTAQAAGEALGAVPEEVGTIAGAANQYLQTGMGATGVTNALLDSPAQYAQDRRQRLRQAMIRRLGSLQEQGYDVQQPQAPMAPQIMP